MKHCLTFTARHWIKIAAALYEERFSLDQRQHHFSFLLHPLMWTPLGMVFYVQLLRVIISLCSKRDSASQMKRKRFTALCSFDWTWSGFAYLCTQKHSPSNEFVVMSCYQLSIPALIKVEISFAVENWDLRDRGSGEKKLFLGNWTFCEAWNNSFGFLFSSLQISPRNKRRKATEQDVDALGRFAVYNINFLFFSLFASLPQAHFFLITFFSNSCASRVETIQGLIEWKFTWLDFLFKHISRHLSLIHCFLFH